MANIVMFKELRKTVRVCLETCEKKRFATIAFPALGTGTLNYPYKVVAKEMFEIAKDFSQKCNPSTLKVVTFIAFDADYKAIMVTFYILCFNVILLDLCQR
jgi:poly [ADP-ribose] polymerase 10/14/15